MADINTIKFTPYQFIGMVVMFIGLIATAIGPYLAVKADINYLNIKFAEVNLKLTAFLDSKELVHKDFEERLDILEINYSEIHDFMLEHNLKNPSKLKK